MSTSADVVLYSRTDWGDAQRLLGSAMPEGLGLSLKKGPEDDCRGTTQLAALKREDGFWLFMLDPSQESPRLSGCDDWEIFNTLAKRCIDIYSIPRDTLRLREHLQLRLNARTTKEDLRLLRDCRELGLVGQAAAFRQSLRTMARLARYNVPVLIKGETGTGKELFARALHYLGSRRDKPFIPINCGALPDTLLESELFGHAKGAFTGAHGEARGLVSQADGGSLFFDEVHTLSPKGQVTLLRFLQDQEFRPVGGSKFRRADVRVVAATNCELQKAVAEGAFREDLFYRLEVAVLPLPALRERREDIPLLAEYAMARLCRHFCTGPRHFDRSAIGWLCAQPWRGNIRELENQVCRALLLSDQPEICVAELTAKCNKPPESPPPHGITFKEARDKVLANFETDYLRSMLERTRGNVSEAARQAGKDRRVFGRLMRKHGVDRADFT